MQKPEYIENPLPESRKVISQPLLLQARRGLEMTRPEARGQQGNCVNGCADNNKQGHLEGTIDRASLLPPAGLRQYHQQLNRHRH